MKNVEDDSQVTSDNSDNEEVKNGDKEASVEVGGDDSQNGSEKEEGEHMDTDEDSKKRDKSVSREKPRKRDRSNSRKKERSESRERKRDKKKHKHKVIYLVMKIDSLTEIMLIRSGANISLGS